MSEDIISRIKIVLKGEGKIITCLKNVSKKENLKNIRNSNNKITNEYYFCDGEDIIETDIEEEFEIGDLIDKEGKVFLKVKSNLDARINDSESKSLNILENAHIEEGSKIENQKESQNEEKQNLENPQISNDKNIEVENPKSNLEQNLIKFIDKISNSKEELRKKLIQNFEENYISSIDDLLNLKTEDLEIFNLPPIIKKKMLEELNNLKPKEELTDSDKNLIQTIFNQDLPPDILFGSLGATSNPQKQEIIKKYYFSLQKPLKPIPQNLKKLVVKTSEENEEAKLPCFHYPAHQYFGKRYYTLLVMGETGSGKTTLLDAFVNYLADMNYEDKWRYKLVDENHIRDLPPGSSQTSDITSYYVNYQREDGNEINIRIVDTPGLGDTGGVGKDNEIIKKFEEFFHTTDEIDYILVTVKATTTRWTQNSQYVYDRVQEIFGKDAKNRFILMCTFADGQKPIAIKTLEKNLHYEEYFCFNNSALYTPSELSKNEKTNTKFFWKLGMENVKRFFEIILKKNLPPLSLKLSKQVMSKRNWLYESVQNSQKIVNEGFAMLDESSQLLEDIKRNKKLIDQNGSFKVKQNVRHPRTVKLDKTYQFCDNCKVMCCQVCEWPPNATESQCSYFDPTSTHYYAGGCPKCPNHCNKYAHVRAKEYTVYDEKEEYVILDAKKKAYDEGQKGLSFSDRLLNETIEKMRKKGEEILKQMKGIKESLEELDRIALKPRVLTNVEYFQQMIDYEKEHKKKGYQKRIEGLEIMKNRAKQLDALTKTDDITQLFSNYTGVITELKSKSNSSCIIY